MDTSFPRLVYHYCSSDVFMKIAGNSTLRMTNISKSNDFEEVVFSAEYFKKAFIDGCRRFISEHSEVEFAKIFKQIDFDCLVENRIKCESLVYYTVCFSETEDLLSQWRGYACDGTGVSIGFDKTIFDAGTKYKMLKFARVNYNIIEAQSSFAQLVYERLLDVYKKEDPPRTSSDYINALTRLMSLLVYNTVFYKNPAFSEEREWRLVFYPFGNIQNLSLHGMKSYDGANQLFYDRMLEFTDHSTQAGNFCINPISFYNKGNNITSYADVDFSKIKKTLIRQIVFGPKSKSNDLDVRLFLLSNGYDLSRIKFRNSIAPYR